ncbi:MAG: magnesium-translocating P-type ATPase [Nanoarchaeota archaeon]
MGEKPFWSVSGEQVLKKLDSQSSGLASKEAKARISSGTVLKPKKQGVWGLLLQQFTSPIILILFIAAVLSFFLSDTSDALIILGIVIVSGLLGFWQEKGASDAVEKLLSLVQVKTLVLREGKQVSIPIEEVVAGDIVMLSAGQGIPGDCRILESRDLFMDEATLTGETYPVEKEAGVLPVKTALARRSNVLFMGTHVVSGSAKALVVNVGKDTELGKVSERLGKEEPPTEFETGIKKFGYFLMEVTLVLVMGIFAINVFLGRHVLNSFLFSLALAVGLTPQLLPAIISINLSQGAKRMALQNVIVRKLSSIENFGSMNVLCSDKTGTLTEGKVHVHSALDVNGVESKKVRLYAYLNAIYESGFRNPIDDAIRRHHVDISDCEKLDEVPYDFVRKRLSVLVKMEGKHVMVTKGSLHSVLSVCSSAEGGRSPVAIAQVKKKLEREYKDLSSKGYRLLGVAYQDMKKKVRIAKEDEKKMTFLGFLVLEDPIKKGVVDTVQRLRKLGVSLKVITGDNYFVARHLSEQVGLFKSKIMTGKELEEMSEEALLKRVNEVDVFAEVEPNHKERIILALRKAGNVVGYMGDGVNDASALHAADVGISVDDAVDVAKGAADIVLLKKDLEVLVEGVKEGRKTFANTMKYVFIATSANFGNMFSMAGASLLLPFLPLLPKQILLTNLFTDLPEMTLASDEVDAELISQPKRWNIHFIRKFMIVFGLVSSIFDFLTFGTLVWYLGANQYLFRTGWFVESVISASVVVLVIRTRKPFFKSRPGKYLSWATLLIAIVTLVLPFTSLGLLFGFMPLPLSFIWILALILFGYMVVAELAKKLFYRMVPF